MEGVSRLPQTKSTADGKNDSDDLDDNDNQDDPAAKQSADPSPITRQPIPRRRSWSRYVVLLLLLGGGSYLGFNEIVTRFTHVYEYDARIGGSLIKVSSRVAGWVDRVYVTEGDDAQKGQIIVEIDPRESKLLADQLEARILGVEADRQRFDRTEKSWSIFRPAAATARKARCSYRRKRSWSH